TAAAPGWAKDGSFTDPRPRPFGPLPREWAKYRGLYLNGPRVTLHYTVGGADVLESPWCETRDDLLVITRSLEIGPSPIGLELAVCQSAGGTVELTTVDEVPVATLRRASKVTAVIVEGSNGAQLNRGQDGRLQLAIPPHDTTVRAKLFHWKGAPSALPQF